MRVFKLEKVIESFMLRHLKYHAQCSLPDSNFIYSETIKENPLSASRCSVEWKQLTGIK
jgi:hypothetical protein